MSSIIQRLICMPRFLSLAFPLSLPLTLSYPFGLFVCVCVCVREGGMLKWQRAFPFPASALHMAAHVPSLRAPSSFLCQLKFQLAQK